MTTRWLGVPEAAERLGYHRKTILTWCEAGLIPEATQPYPGARWRIPEAVIDNWGRINKARAGRRKAA